MSLPQGLTERETFDIFCMKVTPCPKKSSHDWSTCPFAHEGEKARRRCPRTYKYTAIACPNMKQEGRCSLGDNCPFAHNDFEYWLHKERYHTCMCKQGPNCQRKICFFAHNPSELRRPAERPRVPRGSVTAAALAAQQAARARGEHPRPSAPCPAPADAGKSAGGGGGGGGSSTRLCSIAGSSGGGSTLLGAGGSLGFALEQMSGPAELEVPGLDALPAMLAGRPVQLGAPGVPPMAPWPDAQAATWAAALLPTSPGLASYSSSSPTAAPMAPQLPTPGASSGAALLDGSTQALFQAVATELRLGRMDINTATTILGSLLSPPALLQLVSMLKMQAGVPTESASQGTPSPWFQAWLQSGEVQGGSTRAEALLGQGWGLPRRQS